MAHAATKTRRRPQAVAKRPSSHLPAVVQPQKPATILDIINRAAFDKSVDAHKVELLIEMARKVRADDAKAAYWRSLVIMKPKLPVIEKNGRIVIHEKGKDKIDANIIQSSDYALWEDIDAAITPILAEHGFVLTFRTGNQPDGKVTVTGVLSHELGHSEESEMALPLDTSGSKNNVQAAGSSISYGQRYTAKALLNLRFKGQDDDGKAGGNPGLITDSQAEQILELLIRDKADVTLFCKSMKVESIVQLPASRYREAIERINTRSAIVRQKEAEKEAAQ